MNKNISVNDNISFLVLGTGETRKDRLDRLYVQAPGSEIISRREANVKHFDLGNGRRQAVIYPEAVHYRDGNDGPWKEIDNTLIQDTDVHGRSILRNRAGRVQAEFPRQMDGGNMAVLRCGNDTFSWRFEQQMLPAFAVTRTGAQIKQERLVQQAQKTAKYVGRTVESLRAADLSTELESQQTRRASIPAMQAEACYEEVLPGVSLRYEMNGSTLKEDIILADAAALDRTPIRLPDTFCYEATPEGALLVKDIHTGEVRFSMEPPLIYDSNAEFTMGNIRLTPCMGYTRLEYVIDPDFLANAIYPVTIDPVIHIGEVASNTEDVTLKQDSSSNMNSDTYIRCGTGDGKEYVSLLKFKTLPKLTSADTLISAELQLRQNSSAESRCIAVYEVLKPWSASDATWANFNPYEAGNISDEVIDCVSGGSYANYLVTLDLTNLYRKWDTGTADSSNNGIAFRTPANYNVDGNTNNNYTRLYSSNKNGEYYKPKLYINYISHAGIESWWQYEQMSAGRAGTIYADLFNGNVVLEHADTAMSGRRMPVSVSHYYNSCLSDDNTFGCGLGWKTNLHQYVEKVTLGDNEYYIWMDGDGTQHYFKKVSGTHTYPDSEGMGLTLNYAYTDDGMRYTLTDKGDNKTIFDGPSTGRGWMTSMSDACGNTAAISYVSGYEGRIDTVTDGSDRVTSFAYDSEGLLTAVSTPDVGEAIRTVYFTYSSNRLTGIRYSDLGGTASHTTYTYDGSTALLTTARNWDDQQVNITYEAAGSYNADMIDGGFTDQMRRVSSLECVGNNNAKGAKQVFAFKDMCTEVTVVESKDDNAVDGKKLIYQFNDSGNVVCVRDELGYASFTKFASGIENKPSEQSTLRKAVVNLLRSPDFSANWTASSGAAKDTSTRCMNAASVKLTGSDSSPVYYRQQLTLEPGKKYVFSAFVKTENATGSGAYLSLDKNEEPTANPPIAITGSTDAAVGNELPADGWERIHVNLDLTSATAVESYYASLCLNGTGTAYFACPQLEEGSILSPVNLISNSDFRYTYTSGSQTLANDWSTCTNNLATAAYGAFAASADPTFPPALSGGYIQVEGRPNKTNVGFQQVIELDGKKNDSFVLGGWVNALSVPNATTDERHLALTVELRKSDGTYADPTVFAFNSEHVGWQFGSWAMLASRDYSAIRVTASYSKNCCTAKFTNLFLHREQFGESYAYDDNKNVISTTNLAGQKSTVVYDNADNIRRYVQPGLADGDDSNYHRMAYGDTEAEQERHLLLRHRTPMYVIDRYTYDTYGNPTASYRVHKDNMETSLSSLSQPFIRTETTYDDNANYPISTKDARGNTVTKSIDPNTGLVHSVTDPTGQSVEYDYDAAKRVTQVKATTSAGEHINTYTYENDRIKTVSHNTTSDTPDVTYTFNYDNLGRKTSVQVGSQTLSTNVYKNDRNGLLSEVQYGNGGKVKYEYDDFDRITGVKYDGETTNRYTYGYGSNGQAAEVKDNNLNRITRTEFDLSDRPCKVEITSLPTENDPRENLIYRTQLKYDKRSNLHSFTEKLPSETHTTTYTYDRDNRITNIAYDGTEDKVAYVYDPLGRVSTRTANSYTTTFGYVAGGHGTKSTTPLVASITQSNMNFSYTYDNRGNITSETRNSLTTTYEYDALGQLTRVNDPHENVTWVYTYDRGGNMLSKTKYAYTTGTPSGTADVTNFTYDSAWKDKLIGYGGKALEYDDIGNLEKFDGWDYYWIGGRQLAAMEKESTLIEFKYNHNGLRTQKKVVANGITTYYDYTLHGKLITHLTKRVVNSQDVETDREELHFFYDSQSRPAFVEYEGTMYRYVHNLQGDIVGIVDGNNTLVVEYKYSAWGMPISTTGSLAGTLGVLNPFRYRRYVYDEETGLYYLRSRYYNTGINRFISSDCIIANSRCGVFEYAKNSPVIFKDSTGLLPEYTDVIVYLDPNGVHWQIEIFDVIISHEKAGYTLLDPEVCEGYCELTISDVPRDVAIKGMDYLFNLCNPDLVSKYKNLDDLHAAFKDNKKFNTTITSDDYDIYEHPCAAIIDGAYNAMEISFDHTWNALIHNENADKNKCKNANNKDEQVRYSMYLISGQFYKNFWSSIPRKTLSWEEVLNKNSLY